MKPLATVVVLSVGVGCLLLAIWMGQAAPPLSPTTRDPGSAAPAPQAAPPRIAAEGPYPKAIADSVEHDFGTMLHEASGGHLFTIRNEGEAPLSLVVGDITCNCTGAKLGSDEPVPPGGETTVDLTWKIKNPNPSFRHSAKILTNDPQHQVIELVIKGQVEKGLQFDPPSTVWDLGEVSDQTSLESKRVVFSHAMDHFEIREAACSNPRVQCTWEPLDAAALEEYHAKCGYQLHLKVDVADLSGQFEERLTIKTDLEDEVAAELQVRLRKPSPIEIIARNWDHENSRLFLGEFSATEGKTVEINVFTRVEEEVNLLSAESEHQAVKVAWEKDDRFEGKTTKLRRYKLKVEVPPNPATQRQRDQAEKVHLKFDHPKIGTLQISVDYLAI